MAEVWLITGVSGCGRIEMLNDLREYAATKGKTVKVIDVGEVIQKKAVDNHVTFRLSRILNMDQEKLSLLRALAVQSVNQAIAADKTSDIIFIGMHALFLWKNKLIPGVSYGDLMNLKISGVITVVDDVIKISKANKDNPKWQEIEPPSAAALQRWMMEEELLSDIFASLKGVRMFVLARNQSCENLYTFFFEEQKRIYLSYPITAIRENKELNDQIQNEYKPQIERMFYVFNPLDIMDKTHVSKKITVDKDFLSPESVVLVDARTVERDYRFISQSDAVAVIYPTDLISPGVAAEMNYAHDHQIPVFMFYQGAISPFLQEKASVYDTMDGFLSALKDFAAKKLD